MYALLMVLFIILCFSLATVILFLQHGKGDMGLGSMAGSQMLFGGSGGQELFERITWIMGALFIIGALGLSILKSKQLRISILDGSATTQPKQAIKHKENEKADDLDQKATDLDALLSSEQNTATDATPLQEATGSETPLSA